MAGFGAGRVPVGVGRLVIELRSVNHRFLDVRVRAPRDLLDLTMQLELLARQHLKRGRFEIVMRADGVVLPQSTVDHARAQAIHQELCQLRDQLSPGAEVPFWMLALVPDIFVGETLGQEQALLDAMERGFLIAVEAAEQMRANEGNALAQDLLGRLEVIRRHVASIAARRSEIVETYRRKLRDRVRKLLDGLDSPVDAQRLEQEVAITADRCDIEEEITRLSSHFAQFESLCSLVEPVGRRLDFLLQEMGREANTIGAKSQDAPVAHAIVEIKAELERMREQVQNVE